MSTMGERIRTAREKKGIFQSQLATLIGVKSAGVISNWEKDLNKPDAEKIVRLCQALDVSASYLLDYYETKKSPGTDESTPEERRITLEESNRLLVSLGFIQEGQELTDDDLTFLTTIVRLIENWFSKQG